MLLCFFATPVDYVFVVTSKLRAGHRQQPKRLYVRAESIGQKLKKRTVLFRELMRPIAWITQSLSLIFG